MGDPWMGAALKGLEDEEGLPDAGLPLDGRGENGLPVEGLPVEEGLPVDGRGENGLPVDAGLPPDGRGEKGLPAGGRPPLVGLPVEGRPVDGRAPNVLGRRSPDPAAEPRVGTPALESACGAGACTCSTGA